MRYNQHHQYLPVIFIIASLLLTACGERPKTIGVINLAPGLDAAMEGFKEGLAKSGYIQGENINYIYEGATNSIDKLDSVAQGLVAADVDLILSITTPATLAAKRATADTDIPVVFVPVIDPVKAGIVKSLKQPGGNITGITFGLQEGRRVEWLVQVVPTIEQIYIPYNPEDRSAVLALEMANVTAVALGIEPITREARNSEEVTAAVENVPEEADAIFLLPDSLFGAHATEFVKLHLPTSAPNPDDMKNHDMLTSYGIEMTASGKQAARLADQIFQGVKPADLPVEMAEFYLAINLQTAEAIGLDISDKVLLEADIIIR
jgi:putative ABC transport system substrate-binding protein